MIGIAHAYLSSCLCSIHALVVVHAESVLSYCDAFGLSVEVL